MDCSTLKGTESDGGEGEPENSGEREKSGREREMEFGGQRSRDGCFFVFSCSLAAATLRVLQLLSVLLPLMSAWNGPKSNFKRRDMQR